MANAWPKLTHLWLDPAGQWPIPSRITLEGLLPLAEKCTELCTLGISMNTTVSIPRNGVAVRPGKGRVNYQLKALMVGNSHITSPNDIAVFLSDIFPNLKRIDSWLECTREEEIHRDRWNEVAKLIQYFTRVRMQERNWMQCASLFTIPLRENILTRTSVVLLSRISHPALAVLPPMDDIQCRLRSTLDTKST